MAAKVIATCSSRPARRGASHPAQRCAPSAARLSLASTAVMPVKAEQPSALRPQMGQSLLEPAVTPAKPSRLQQTKVLGEAAQAAAFATPAPEQVGPLRIGTFQMPHGWSSCSGYLGPTV